MAGVAAEQRLDTAAGRVEALDLVVVGIGDVDRGLAVLRRRLDPEGVLQAGLVADAVGVAEVEQATTEEAADTVGDGAADGGDAPERSWLVRRGPTRRRP